MANMPPLKRQGKKRVPAVERAVAAAIVAAAAHVPVAVNIVPS